MNDWINFLLVIFVQFLFFLFVAYKKKRIKTIPKVLLQSGLIGLFFGITSDLFFGQYLNVFGYYLGFGWLFLAINGILSYGLMIATVSLLDKDNFSAFYVWTICLGAVYELINYFSPLWTWHFTNNFLLQEFILLFAVYFGLSSLMALTLYFTINLKFKYLSFLK